LGNRPLTPPSVRFRTRRFNGLRAYHPLTGVKHIPYAQYLFEQFRTVPLCILRCLNTPRSLWYFRFHLASQWPAGFRRFLFSSHHPTFLSLRRLPLFGPSHSVRTPLSQRHPPSRYYGHGNFVSTLTSGCSAIHLCMDCDEDSTAPFHHVPSRPPQVRAGNLHPI
jgi:hypothetical protein